MYPSGRRIKDLATDAMLKFGLEAAAHDALLALLQNLATPGNQAKAEAMVKELSPHAEEGAGAVTYVGDHDEAAADFSPR